MSCDFTIYVICPDDPTPSGGMRKLYRHVDVLNQAGYSAMILHEGNSKGLKWFENQTPIAVKPVKMGINDIVVVPEIFGQAISEMVPPLKKVIINQGAYQTFLSFN